MEALIERWGLVAVFLGTLLEGDLAMLLTGVVAHVGLLKFPTALLTATAGAFLSDVAWFSAGRWQARRIRGSAFFRRAGPSIVRIADRMGSRQVLFCRFIYGTRVPTVLLWGVRGLGFPRFLALDLAGCILWAVACGCRGYFLSGSAELITGRVRRVEHWLLGALVVAIGVVLGLKALAGWQKRRAASGPC